MADTDVEMLITLIKNLNRRLLKLERAVYEKHSSMSIDTNMVDQEEQVEKRVYSKEKLTAIHNTIIAKGNISSLNSKWMHAKFPSRGLKFNGKDENDM